MTIYYQIAGQKSPDYWFTYTGKDAMSFVEANLDIITRWTKVRPDHGTIA